MPPLPIPETAFVALDLEATGVAFGHDRIVEIGAVRFTVDRDGHVVPSERFHTLVNPGIPLPVIVSRLTGLDDAALADAPPLERVWDDLVAFTTDTVVVAHQVRADLSWLAAEALRLQRTPLENDFYCTLHLARRAIPGAPRYSLPALIEHLGLKPGTHHRAMADALHTRNLFAHCVGRVRAREFRDFGAIEPERWPGADAFAVHVPLHLQGLDAAIAGHEPVAIRYRGGSHGHVWRPVTPLGFFASAGIPYLRAWCHLSDEGRSFRCDRISAWRQGEEGSEAAALIHRRSFAKKDV
jgi:DNA polymerase-3 subunit epsilon